MKARTKYNRLYQQRRRASKNLRSVTIELSRTQRRYLTTCQRFSKYAERDFLKLSLLRGAAFCANSGQVPYRKRVKTVPV